MVFLNYDLGKKILFFFRIDKNFDFYRWILQAMKLGLEHLKADVEDAVVTLNTLSPNEIKQLLYFVLTIDLQQPTSLQTGDVEQR
jgi:hypothetical protein